MIFVPESKTRTLRKMPSVSCMAINLICKSIESVASILFRGGCKKAREITECSLFKKAEKGISLHMVAIKRKVTYFLTLM